MEGNTREFLIVDDSILNMPDCTLSIKNLSDREIEIKLDPKPKQPDPPITVNKETETERTKSNQTEEVLDSNIRDEEETPNKEP